MAKRIRFNQVFISSLSKRRMNGHDLCHREMSLPLLVGVITYTLVYRKSRFRRVLDIFDRATAGDFDELQSVRGHIDHGALCNDPMDHSFACER